MIDKLIKKIQKEIENTEYNMKHFLDKKIVESVYVPRLAEKKLILKSLTETSQLQKEITALRNVIFRVRESWNHKNYIPQFLVKEMQEV